MAAAMAPSLPAVREEEDEATIVEFGNTELHRQAAHKGEENSEQKKTNSVFLFDRSDANLSTVLRENYYNIASRNAQGKTARDLAIDAGLQENADQIGERSFRSISHLRLAIFRPDQYCLDLLQHGNTKAISDLLLYGYTEVIEHLKKSDDLSDQSKHFLDEDAPQYLVRRTTGISRSTREISRTN